MNLSESYKKRLQELAGLFEVDYFKVDQQEFHTEDSDAIAFLYYGGKLFIKNAYGHPSLYKRCSHWEIVTDIIGKGIEDGEITIEKKENGEEYWQEIEEEMMKNTKYNGRIWVDRKTISFWKIPEDRFVLKDIVDDLNNDSMGEFHIDGSWNIRVGGERGVPDRLISLKDYTGGEISDEEKKDLEDKWKAHIMSPIEKEKRGLRSVPKGFGSKNPDYLSHRTWDRAIGRAE